MYIIFVAFLSLMVSKGHTLCCTADVDERNDSFLRKYGLTRETHDVQQVLENFQRSPLEEASYFSSVERLLSQTERHITQLNEERVQKGKTPIIFPVGALWSSKHVLKVMQATSQFSEENFDEYTRFVVNNITSPISKDEVLYFILNTYHIAPKGEPKTYDDLQSKIDLFKGIEALSSKSQLAMLLSSNLLYDVNVENIPAGQLEAFKNPEDLTKYLHLSSEEVRQAFRDIIYDRGGPFNPGLL